MATSIEIQTHGFNARLYDALVDWYRAMITASPHAQWLPLGSPGKAVGCAFELMPIRRELDHLNCLAHQSIQTEKQVNPGNKLIANGPSQINPSRSTGTFRAWLMMELLQR